MTSMRSSSTARHGAPETRAKAKAMAAPTRARSASLRAAKWTNRSPRVAPYRAASRNDARRSLPARSSSTFAASSMGRKPSAVSVSRSSFSARPSALT